MKTIITSSVHILVLSLALYSCKEEENFSPIKGKETFSPSRVTKLNLQIHYPDAESYDSAYIVFTNSEKEVKQKLILNNSTYTATGVVTSIPSGKWAISTSFFNTIEPNYVFNRVAISVVSSGRFGGERFERLLTVTLQSPKFR